MSADSAKEKWHTIIDCEKLIQGEITMSLSKNSEKETAAYSLQTFRNLSVDSFPDISEATEYKDAPITFTLHDTRERQVEIKIVEPEVDYPLPENQRI